jgi:hypothetical protein
MYSSTLSLTSGLDGLGGQRHALDDLTPGKTRYPLHRRLGGPQGRSVRVRNISPPLGFDPRTVQPVASRYADYAILALVKMATLKTTSPVKRKYLSINLGSLKFIRSLPYQGA